MITVVEPPLGTELHTAGDEEDRPGLSKLSVGQVGWAEKIEGCIARYLPGPIRVSIQTSNPTAEQLNLVFQKVYALLNNRKQKSYTDKALTVVDDFLQQAGPSLRAVGVLDKVEETLASLGTLTQELKESSRRLEEEEPRLLKELNVLEVVEIDEDFGRGYTWHVRKLVLEME